MMTSTDKSVYLANILIQCFNSMPDEYCVNAIDHYVKSGGDINYVQHNGLRFMQSAAQKGLYKCIEKLAALGLSVNCIGGKSMNASLQFAIILGCSKTVYTLLKLGADTTIVADNGDYIISFVRKYKISKVIRLVEDYVFQGVLTEPSPDD